MDLTEPDRAVLVASQLFRGLAAADIDALVPAFGVRELPARRAVYRQDEQGGFELFVVLTGRLPITSRTGAGQSRGELVGPGEVFGELSVFDPGPRERTATALTGVRLAVLSRAAFLDWALARPRVSERLLRVLARRLRRTDADALDLLFVDVGARLAKALCELAGRFGQPTASGLLVEHGLSQRQLAEMVGTSRESLNRQLHGFAERGWLVAGRGLVVIRDPDRLARRAAPAD